MPGPLEGFTIVDLSQLVSGPLATMLLADQGAAVVKVEPLGFGDVTRVPSFSREEISAFYLNNNRGKRSLALDLSADAGREIVRDLVADADVFVQNFRPGAIERLGLGEDDLRAVNPDLIFVSISGFGPTGPYADRPVLDPVIQGLSGMISRQLNPSIPFPDMVRNLYADKSTALTAAQAITAALLARERGAGGQHIQVPMLDATLYFFWPDGMMDKTIIGEQSPGALLSTLYNLTETADGQIVYFVVSDPQRHGLFRALERPELIDDPRYGTMAALQAENFVKLGVILGEAFREFDTETILERLAAEDVPSGPILDADEVFADPQVRHNDTLVTWTAPHVGEVRQPRPAARFSSTPAEVAPVVAKLGEHTDEILAELGRTPAAIAALKEGGTIA
jgi:crotonobetainyl-CoA:carnitine CoA-transferase CaiB-like acyl-CoA transferase